MLKQILIGGIASLANIAVHSLWTVFLDVAIRRHAQRRITAIGLGERILLMVGSVAILLFAHVSEVMLWSVTYMMVGVTPAGGSHIYFAFVNYTTPGYGDLVPDPEWRLLGPLTAMDGILLFGWSTAIIFDIVQMTLRSKISGAQSGVGQSEGQR